jgi:hypothetical protein
LPPHPASLPRRAPAHAPAPPRPHAPTPPRPHAPVPPRPPPGQVFAIIRHTCGATVRAEYAPGAFHGSFLVFPALRATVVAAVGEMARAAACDSHALIQAAAHATVGAGGAPAPAVAAAGAAGEGEALQPRLAAAAEAAACCGVPGALVEAEAGCSPTAAAAAAESELPDAAPCRDADREHAAKPGRGRGSLRARLLSFGRRPSKQLRGAALPATPEAAAWETSSASDAEPASDLAPREGVAPTGGEAVLSPREASAAARAVRRAATAPLSLGGGKLREGSGAGSIGRDAVRQLLQQAAAGAAAPAAVRDAGAEAAAAGAAQACQQPSLRLRVRRSVSVMALAL